MSEPYPRYKLTQDPLALALCQIQFSRIQKMQTFIPEIQDRIRKEGFPEDLSSPVQRMRVGIGKPPEFLEGRHNEFRSKEGHWGIVIEDHSLALFTTEYDRYSGFAARLRNLLNVVDEVAGISHGSVTRVGLRYIDVVAPQEGEGWRDYLAPGIHGPTSPMFKEGYPLIGQEFTGLTQHGLMVVRISQNNQGAVVPPGTLVKPMSFRQTFSAGKLLTLIDTDHYVEGQWDYDLHEILDTVDVLHKGSNTVFFNSLITEHALKAWGAQHADVNDAG